MPSSSSARKTSAPTATTSSASRTTSSSPSRPASSASSLAWKTPPSSATARSTATPISTPPRCSARRCNSAPIRPSSSPASSPASRAPPSPSPPACSPAVTPRPSPGASSPRPRRASAPTSPSSTTSPTPKASASSPPTSPSTCCRRSKKNSAAASATKRSATACNASAPSPPGTSGSARPIQPPSQIETPRLRSSGHCRERPLAFHRMQTAWHAPDNSPLFRRISPVQTAGRHSPKRGHMIRFATLPTVLAFLALSTCAPAFAQSADQARTAHKDTEFLKAANQGSVDEINLAQIALKKSDDQDVKNFAQKMVDDHTKLLDDMKKFDDEAGLTVPEHADAGTLVEEAKLELLSGKSFDKSYIKKMVEDHQIGRASCRERV